MFKKFLLVILASYPLNLAADDLVKKTLESNFATAVLLSDSEAITFGFQSFDPNVYVDIDDNLGGAESLELRKQISIYSLPYSIPLDPLSLDNGKQVDQVISIVGSYYTVNRDIDLTGIETDAQDRVTDEIYTLSFKYKGLHPLNESWSISGNIKANTMYFRNSYTYPNSVSDELQNIIDGNVVNTTAWSLVLEPSVELRYKQPYDTGRWEYFTELNYFYGVGWGEANNGNVGNPEGWYWVNGVKGFYDIANWGNSQQSLYTSFRRIDLGADLEQPMGTAHYYELSLGWLITPPFLDQYIENVGLGLNFNYGSSLKGGSILLLFNQE